MKLTITGNKGVDIQDDMFGIFFEDINYGADGGIYAEMIENRSFEFVDAYGDKDAYYQKFDGMYGWSAYPDEGRSSISIRDITPLNTVNPHYLHVECAAGEGFANKAYDGMYMPGGQTAVLRFYARTAGKATLTVGALSRCAAANAAAGSAVATAAGSTATTATTAAGSTVTPTFTAKAAESRDMSVLGRIIIEGTAWKQYEVQLKADCDIRHAQAVFTLDRACKADFDCISMFPGDAVCGLFRRDLAELLKDLHPGFMRFPGGCVVEGNDLANRYQWKNTVGDIAERPANWNRWAVHMNSAANDFHSQFSHYNQTLGLGYYEYFVLCEYLGAAPVPVANVGLACQYQSHQLIRRDDPAYDSFIQDVLDLIEFANGPVSTKWGALRAQMGHPAPFGLRYIGIGNEQWQTEDVDFFERYDDFEQRIHAVYPDIRLLGSAGPTVGTKTYTAAWDNYRTKEQTCGKAHAYAVDEHYYMEPEWFLKNTHFYDDYPREVKVFSGEYAAHDSAAEHEPLQHNNLRAAVAEAAFLTGVERNSDVVRLACYAPLFARIGYAQWHPDLIWFDDHAAYGTPSYYVQQLYATATGTQTVLGTLDGNAETEGVFAAVSERGSEKFIKLVNASADTKEMEIELPAGWKDLNMSLEQMSGKPEAANSIESPKAVAFTEPVPCLAQNGRLQITLPAWSVSLVSNRAAGKYTL